MSMVSLFKKIGRKISIENIKLLFKKRFIRNVITVASGTALAQVIIMLFSPFITRLYGPEAFGLLGIFTSILSIIMPIAALTYPIAIVLPKKDSEAKGIMKLSFYLSIIISTIIFIVLFFGGERIAFILDAEAITPYLLLIPFVMLAAAIRQILEQWLYRKRLFKVTAKVAVFQSLIVNSTKLGVGVISPIGSSLILIQAIGYMFHMSMLSLGARISLKKNQEKAKDKLSKKELLKLAKKHKDFPIYRAPQVLLAGITYNVPVLMLTGLFGPVAAGLYTLSNRVLAMPSQLLGSAVGDVFYPRITEAAQKKEDISKLLLKASVLMAVIGAIPYGIIMLFGPKLFSFIFGAEWYTAGVYAAWVALWSYALFISRPSIKTLPVLSAQRFHLIYTIFNIAIRVGALLIGGIVFKNDIVAIALFGVTGALLSIILTIMTIQKSKTYMLKENKKSI